MNEQVQQQAVRTLFFGGRQARCLRVASTSALDQALLLLGLKIPTPVMVLVGGAAGMEKRHEVLIQETIALLANLAEELQLTVLDGGTRAGVKAFMGEARTAGAHSFPLLGVAVECLVHEPKQPATAFSIPLESNHTHFLFVPGQEWGDESFWLSEVASRLSQTFPSLTILINGGEISRQDVNHSLRAKRPVLILQGTGRLADELSIGPPSSLVQVVPARDLQTVSSTIRTLVTRR